MVFALQHWLLSLQTREVNRRKVCQIDKTKNKQQTNKQPNKAKQNKTNPNCWRVSPNLQAACIEIGLRATSARSPQSFNLGNDLGHRISGLILAPGMEIADRESRELKGAHKFTAVLYQLWGGIPQPRGNRGFSSKPQATSDTAKPLGVDTCPSWSSPVMFISTDNHGKTAWILQREKKLVRNIACKVFLTMKSACHKIPKQFTHERGAATCPNPTANISFHVVNHLVPGVLTEQVIKPTPTQG